jgi:predicted  nucleic acid-binding Zn-ribbon protein
LQEAVSAMQGGNADKSSQKGSSAQMNMEQLLAALSQMQSGYYDDQKQEIIAGIKEEMTALSELEKQAGELSDKIENQNGDTTKEQMSGSGALGAGISGVMKKYSQIMGQTLFLSPEGLKQLENAEKTLTDLSENSASREQALDKLGEAMQGMNSAMLNLWAAKGGVENASTPSGLADMLSALEQIASGQQQLGGGMQSLFGGGMPVPSREQLLAMAAAQAALRQALEQLLQKYGALEQMTGELSGAVDAMKDIEKMLSEGTSNGRIAEEQKHLMERLLSAERSLRTKGVSTERKSEPAKYYPDPYVPEHLPPGVDLPSRFEAQGVEDIYGQEIPFGYGDLIEQYWGGGER